MPSDSALLVYGENSVEQANAEKSSGFPTSRSLNACALSHVNANSEAEIFPSTSQGDLQRLVHAVRHGLSFVFLISAHRHEHETDGALESNGIDAMISDFIGTDPNAGLARPPVIDETVQVPSTRKCLGAIRNQLNVLLG
jgi:hypothetical protein